VVRFNVVIDGKLTAAQQQAINASIQQAVLPHLAELGRGERDLAVLPHKDWLGLIALELSAAALREGLPQVGKIEQQLGIR
jgi:hypothetical protein